MKLIAKIYSLLVGGVALWAWVVHFYYEGTTREHLLPAIVLQVVTLPSSLLIEWIVELLPWILSSPVAIILIMTGLGAIQAIAVWFAAIYFKFSRA
jgi:hypothetical protein